jgi:hypothetical protein
MWRVWRECPGTGRQVVRRLVVPCAHKSSHLELPEPVPSGRHLRLGPAAAAAARLLLPPWAATKHGEQGRSPGKLLAQANQLLQKPIHKGGER